MPAALVLEVSGGRTAEGLNEGTVAADQRVYAIDVAGLGGAARPASPVQGELGDAGQFLRPFQCHMTIRAEHGIWGHHRQKNSSHLLLRDPVDRLEDGMFAPVGCGHQVLVSGEAAARRCIQPCIPTFVIGP